MVETIVAASATLSIVSAFISLFLLVMAVRVYTRTHDATMAFLIGAFTVFMFKSLIVGYAVLTGAIEHESLELIDAGGDLATVLLLVTPIFLVRGPDAQ